MKKRLRIVPVVILIFYSCAFGQIEYKEVCFKDICVQAEIADTEAERQGGLMSRNRLPDGYGMLFVFEKAARHSFWMKNMRFPLDIIWLSKEKQVVHIAKNVPPCQDTCDSIIPPQAASYALEVNAGFADKYSIEVGSKLTF